MIHIILVIAIFCIIFIPNIISYFFNKYGELREFVMQLVILSLYSIFLSILSIEGYKDIEKWQKEPIKKITKTIPVTDLYR